MPQYNVYIQPKKYGNLRRRRKIAVFFAAIFSAIVLISGGIYLVFYSPFFEIKNLRLTCEAGNGNCRPENEEELRNNLNLFFNQTLFLEFKKNKLLLFKIADLEQFIAANMPKIAVSGSRKIFWERTVEINYSERKMAGIYCSAQIFKTETTDKTEESGGDSTKEISEEIGPCFYIDETGTAYEEAPQSSGSLIVLIKDYGIEKAETGKQVVNPQTLAAISRIQYLFRKNLNIEISEIKLNSAGKNSIEIGTKNGWRAIFPAPTEPAKLDNSESIDAPFSALRAVLEKEIKEKQNELEYIDLRFGTKVYYKFRGNN